MSDALTVIPAPARSGAVGTEPVVELRAGDGIAAPPEFRAVAGWFAAVVSDALGGPLAVTEDAGAARVLLVLDADAGGSVPLAGGVSPLGDQPADERYRLAVTPGAVTVSAGTAEGAFRGLSTLRQLIDAPPARPGAAGPGDAADAATVALPELDIVDGPRFAWRGLSLDVARTFFSVDQVKAVIDLIADYKLNVLHLHLTDDHGWRLHIEGWPLLTEVGGQGAVGDRPGGYYTQEQFRDLVDYAAARFVTVVPEIDLPGHTSAVFKAYPQLARPGTDFSGQPETFGAHFATLDPNQAGTFGFVADVLREVAALTPGRYLHIGGDEPFGMPDDEYRDFVDGARAIVLDLGKHLIGWQEIARAGIGAGDVIQYWMSLRPGVVDFTSLAELPEGMELPADPDPAIMETYAKAGRDIGLALAKGAQVLMSPLAVTYLDVGYADELEDPAQRGDWERVRMPVWPRITVEQAWDWEPTEWAPELPANAVAGVEAALWSEVVEDVRDLGFLLLPRLPGLAERAWSAAGQRDWAVYRPRIAAHAARWRRAGWTTYFRSAALADPPPVPAASPAERA